MLKSVKSVFRRALAYTPYEINRRIPPSTFNAVKLALAYYCSNFPQGTLVQVGANDGKSADPIYDFITSGRMRAILVEPIEQSFQRLINNYRDVKNVSLVQAAIAHEDGEATMFRAKNSGRWREDNWVDKITSFDRSHLIKHGIRSSEIEAVTVPALSLSSLLKNFDLAKIGFLQVDAEGFDAEVVKMALALPMPPEFINFEHSNLNRETIESVFLKLKESRYSWVVGKVDTLAIHHRAAQEMRIS